jgi:hypothetical protein
MKNAEGNPLFRHNIKELNDTADPPVVFRNALLAQRNGDTILVLAGPATDLIQLLALNGGRDLVASKAKLLLVAAGSYHDGPADPRILADVAAARQLFATWPTPIIAVGLGLALPAVEPAVISSIVALGLHIALAVRAPVPVMVMWMSCAVPSDACTVMVSGSVAPALSACTAASMGPPAANTCSAFRARTTVAATLPRAMRGFVERTAAMTTFEIDCAALVPTFLNH